MNKKILFFLALFLSAMLPLRAQTPIQINGLWYNLDNVNYTATVTYPNTSNAMYAYNGYTAPSGDIVIPSSVSVDATTYNVTAIGDNAFRTCNRITSVTFPESVSTISPLGTFIECSSLSSFNVVSSNTNFSVQDGVLFNSDKTTLVRFPPAKEVTSYNIPNTVTTLEEYSFEECQPTSITFPEAITIIPRGTFVKCNNFTTFNIPSNITSIGMLAFFSCVNLKSVTIPNSVSEISTYAFGYCNRLEEVWLLTATAPTQNIIGGIDAFNGAGCNPGTDLKFYVPFGSKTSYSGAANWSSYNARFVEGVLIDGVRYVSTDAPGSGVVRYTRTFNSGNWVPLFVPIGFAVSELGGDFQVAELSSVAYNAAGYDVMSWNIVTTVQANHPYIIRYTGTESYELDHIFDSRTIASSETTAFTSTVCNNGGSDENARRYTLTGTYEEKVYGDGTEWYAMGGGNFWPATTGNSLPAQRFFLTITDPNKTPGQDGYYKSAPQGGTIIRVGEENVGIIRPEGTIMLPADDNYYDLLGRRVEQPQKGNIYIHNHKKIVY